MNSGGPMRAHAFDSRNTGLLDRIIWRMRTAQIRDRLPGPVGRIADFGCGSTAPLLRTLLDAGLAGRATGIDLHPAADTADQRLTLVQADLNAALPLDDCSFDAVLSLATLEHLDAPELHLREILRTLRPGGMLLLTTPTARAKPVLEFLAYRLGVIDRAEIEDHRRYFSPATLAQALRDSGFAADSIRSGTFQLGMNNIVSAHKPASGA